MKTSKGWQDNKNRDIAVLLTCKPMLAEIRALRDKDREEQNAYIGAVRSDGMPRAAFAGGDGMTDIPSMKLTKQRGGNAIAVYTPHSRAKKKAMKLLVDNRVNFALPADYSENKEIDIVVKTILDKIATERDLDILKAKEEKKKHLLKERM